MAMSNREITALERLTRSQQALAEAITSGRGAAEYKKARLALEAATGGAKKLAQADRVLAEAETKAATMCVEAEEAAGRIADDATKIVAALTTEMEDAAGVVARREMAADGLEDANDKLNRELVDRAGELKKIGDKQTVRAGELDRESRAVARREADVAVREAKANEFDAWRAGAPV